MSDSNAEVHSVLASINAAWREGDPSSMREYLDPDIVMLRLASRRSFRGREILVESFLEFGRNARVLEYAEDDEHIDVVGECAVASFHFRMFYERATYREESEGRDLWVFQRREGRWQAVWRTMLEAKAERLAATV